MIKFDLHNESSEVLSEGIKNIDKAFGADAGEIKDTFRDFKDGDASILDVAQTVDQKGVAPVADVTDKISGIMGRHTVDTRSIVARARNSVLQFPMYITQGIPVASAHIVAGYFERVYATLVQTVLSQNPIIRSDEMNNMQFLRQFHANLREAADRFYNEFYEPIDESDRMMKESVFHSVQISENVWLEFRAIPCVDETLITENARMLNDPFAGFDSLMEAPTRYTGGKVATTTQKRDTPDRILHPDELQRIVDDIVAKTPAGQTPKVSTVDELEQRIRSGIPVKSPDGQIRYRPGRSGADEFYIQGKPGDRTTTEVLTSTEPKDAVKAPIMLRDPEIKKINAMLPWTFEASFRVQLPDGTLDNDIRFIIGVKTVLHLISPKDITTDLRELIMGNVKGLQNVRYKTGEITRKDYLFNPKGLRADASKHINPQKRWINTLKRLSDYDKLKGTLLKGSVKAMAGGQVPIPNGTLILSQPDVTMIVNETGIDLSEVAQAKRLGQSLFLIAVVIVDTTAETMRVLFIDSDVEWDVQSLASLDADLAKTDNSAMMREIQRGLHTIR